MKPIIVTGIYDSETGDLIAKFENLSVESLEGDLRKMEKVMAEANDFSADYPLGGMVEPYDIEEEKNLLK